MDAVNGADRPWKAAGQDVSDYFNYGFNEVTWRIYCLKQKALREDPQIKAFAASNAAATIPPLPRIVRIYIPCVFNSIATRS